MGDEIKYQLPKEFGQKWLTALRSGKFIQGRDNLVNWEDNEDQNHKTYCCLGVACHIANPGNDKMMSGMGYPYQISNDFNLGIPELLTVGDAKQDSVDMKQFVWIVANLNDQGQDFFEIADWIEANVEMI